MRIETTPDRQKQSTEEQILGILKKAERGKPLPDFLHQHSISSGTYYRWKSRHGGLETSQLQRLKQLERENTELKKIVTDLVLDIRILKDVTSKKRVEPAARRAAVD